jgi:hypothetical protein
MARRIVRWLTPSKEAAAVAESSSTAATCPLAAVHTAGWLSIARSIVERPAVAQPAVSSESARLLEYDDGRRRVPRD